MRLNAAEGKPLSDKLKLVLLAVGFLENYARQKLDQAGGPNPGGQIRAVSRLQAGLQVALLPPRGDQLPAQNPLLHRPGLQVGRRLALGHRHEPPLRPRRREGEQELVPRPAAELPRLPGLPAHQRPRDVVSAEQVLHRATRQAARRPRRSLQARGRPARPRPRPDPSRRPRGDQKERLPALLEAHACRLAELHRDCAQGLRLPVLGGVHPEAPEVPRNWLCAHSARHPARILCIKVRKRL